MLFVGGKALNILFFFPARNPWIQCVCSIELILIWSSDFVIIFFFRTQWSWIIVWFFYLLESVKDLDLLLIELVRFAHKTFPSWWCNAELAVGSADYLLNYEEETIQIVINCFIICFLMHMVLWEFGWFDGNRKILLPV